MTIREITRRFEGHVPALLGAREHYAVLVPLVEGADGPALLFEVRAASLRRQPGEVCFPGGKMEPGEDPVACALRETEEELGISPAAVRPIALLDYLHHQGGFVMHPVLGEVDPAAVAAMRPARAEVAEAFLVPLSFFERTEPAVYTYPLEPKVGEDFPYERLGLEGYRWRGGSVEVPIYNYGGHAIWGMTGRVVRSLVSP